MPDLKGLEGKELVLRITGGVQSSNLAGFEKDALEVIGNINTDLNTDQDFVEAEQNIKSCDLIETRIHNARQDALTSTEDIAALITTTERLEAKFREVRLVLNKKVKSEKNRRKFEITSTAIDILDKLITSSRLAQSFLINREGINNAVKGKRSLGAMQKAVDIVVDEETILLNSAIDNFTNNMGIIAKAEKEYPGLFPDKDNLALSSLEVVASQVESRVATFNYKQEMIEKKKREDLERAKKLEKTQETELRSHEVRKQPVFNPPPLPESPPLPQQSNEDEKHNVTTHELAKELFDLPDKPVAISLDISTCDENAGDRAFSGEYFGVNDAEADEIILLFRGSLNTR